MRRLAEWLAVAAAGAAPVLLAVALPGWLALALHHRGRGCPGAPPVCGQLNELAQAVQIYAARHSGRLPDALAELAQGAKPGERGLGREKLLDPWGTPIAYTKAGKKFKLTSAGPDRQLETADDITR